MENQLSDIIKKSAALDEKEKQENEAIEFLTHTSPYGEDIFDFYINAGEWNKGAKNYLQSLYKNNSKKYQEVITWAKEEKSRQEEQVRKEKEQREKKEKEERERKEREQQEKIEKEERIKKEKEQRFAAEFMATTDKYYTQESKGSYSQKFAMAKEDLVKYEKNNKNKYQEIMNAANLWQNEEIKKYVENCKTAYKEALAIIPNGAFNAQLAEKIKNTKEKDLKEYQAIMAKTRTEVNSAIPYLWDTQPNQGGNILSTWLEKRIKQEREQSTQEQSTPTKNCIERVIDEIKSVENQTIKEKEVHQIALDFYKIVYLQAFDKLEADLKHKKIDIDLIISERTPENITNEIKNAFTALDIDLCDGQGARIGIGAGIFSGLMQEAYNKPGSRIRTWYKVVEEQLAFEVTFKYKTEGKTESSMDATDFLIRAKERFAHKKAFMFTPALIILDVYTSFFYEYERKENLGWQGKTYMAKHTATRTITCEVTANLYAIGLNLSNSDSIQYDPQAGKEMVPVHYRV